MSLKRVILHIGTGKTGTSTIQVFLSRNASTLLSRGFLSLHPGSLETFRQSDIHDTGRLEGGLQEILGRCRKANTHSLIWSMEALGTRQFADTRQRVEAIRDKLDAEEFRVIAYLRRQDYFTQSGYLQWGIVHKTYPGPVRTFEEQWKAMAGPNGMGLADTNLNYHRVIEPWAEVFGRENVTVRPFEKDQWAESTVVAGLRCPFGNPASAL